MIRFSTDDEEENGTPIGAAAGAIGGSTLALAPGAMRRARAMATGNRVPLGRGAGLVRGLSRLGWKGKAALGIGGALAGGILGHNLFSSRLERINFGLGKLILFAPGDQVRKTIKAIAARGSSAEYLNRQAPTQFLREIGSSYASIQAPGVFTGATKDSFAKSISRVADSKVGHIDQPYHRKILAYNLRKFRRNEFSSRQPVTTQSLNAKLRDIIELAPMTQDPRPRNDLGMFSNEPDMGPNPNAIHITYKEGAMGGMAAKGEGALARISKKLKGLKPA
jgi:hypothetical protein